MDIGAGRAANLTGIVEAPEIAEARVVRHAIRAASGAWPTL
jgi:hypothetical protein